MLNIRRIRSEDWDLFRTLRLSALRESPLAFGSSFEAALQRSEASWREQVHASSSGPHRFTALAYWEQRAVGLAALYELPEKRPRSAELLQVWTHPDYRGQGIGRELIAALVSWARHQNFDHIIATIHRENDQVIEFYEKLGFNFDKQTTLNAPQRDLIFKLVLASGL